MIVRNKTDVLFDAPAVSVSMVNELGPFDVLPEHTNYIGIIGGEVVVREDGGKEKRLTCTRGVTRVTTNTVEVVFLE